MSGLIDLYRRVSGMLEPLVPAVLRARARRGKEDPKRLGERLGRPSRARPRGFLIWLHGASVGEGLSILPLAEALKARTPGLNLLVTSGTTTSAEVLAARLPEGVIHQYAPVDGPRVIARFLSAWKPNAVVLVESEIWPNLVLGCWERRIPVALISARLSDRSLKGWRRTGADGRRLMGAFGLVMAQDDRVAEGLKALGARDDGRANLKLAGDPLPVDPAAIARARTAAGPRPVLVAASTHPGEEAIVLEAFRALSERPDAPLLIIVPRHPKRGGTVAALAAAKGFAVRRQGAGEGFSGAADVYVADALGELGLWFSLAWAAFVGGSLVPGVGGHNPLEPARLNTPAIAGPHVDNWRSVYDALGDRIVRVADAAELSRAFAQAIDAPEAAAVRAAHARGVAEAGAAQLDYAAERVLALLA